MLYAPQNYTQSVVSGTPFVHADEHFLKYALADKDFNKGFSGACALVAHVQRTSSTNTKTTLKHETSCLASVTKRRFSQRSKLLRKQNQNHYFF